MADIHDTFAECGVPRRSAGGPRMRRSCTHRGSGECTIGCWAVDKCGLYAKFIVKRSDGRDGPGEKHEHCDYFVLDLTHDEHAKAAIIAYANDCAEKRPQLALDLRVRVGAVDLSEAKPAGELAQEEAAASGATSDDEAIKAWSERWAQCWNSVSLRLPRDVLDLVRDAGIESVVIMRRLAREKAELLDYIEELEARNGLNKT